MASARAPDRISMYPRLVGPDYNSVLAKGLTGADEAERTPLKMGKRRIETPPKCLNCYAGAST